MTEDNNTIVNNEKNELTREDIIAELETSYTTINLKQAKEYQKKWKRFDSWDSAYDQDLNNRFYELINHCYNEQNKSLKDNELAKIEIIETAKNILNNKDFKSASTQMDTCMNKWKETKSAGRDLDNTLWNDFNSIRDIFYKNKSEYYKTLDQNRELAKTTKQNLIEKAKELATNTNFSKTTKDMDLLFDEWKKAGPAPREFDQVLWEEFYKYRKDFFEKRDAFYKEQDVENKLNYEKKMKLIDETKELLVNPIYNKDAIEKMKSLQVQFKEIGHAGKRSQKLYTEFRSLHDSYFDGLTKYHEDKNAQYTSRLVESRDYKSNQIQQQQRQIERLRNDLIGTISEKVMRDIEEEITNKEEYIKELVHQIIDIDSKINPNE